MDSRKCSPIMPDESAGSGAGQGGIGDAGKFYEEQVTDLLAFAEKELELSRVVKDGSENPLTVRDHYNVIWRKTGNKPAELVNDCPDGMGYLWQWFVELHHARQSNGFGISPLSYSEMLAWSELTNQKPSPSDIKTIKRIDLIALSQKSE